MPSPVHLVYKWTFSQNRAYVFYGPEGMPESVWSRRGRFESKLNDELRAHDIMPLAEEVISTPVFAYQARTLARLERERLKADGWTVLSARGRETIVAGSNAKPRPLYAIYWNRQSWFPSVAAASRALGIPEDAVRRKCEDGIEARWDPCRK